MNAPFDTVTIAELRRRRSAKWTSYPPDVLPAWIAEMDVALDPAIRDALVAAVDDGDTGYVNAREVGASFARFTQHRFGWNPDPHHVIVAPDVLVAIAEVLRAVTLPGAAIVVNSPVYPPFYRIVPEVGRAVDNVPLLRADAGWSLDFAGLERAFAAGAAAYLLCSPHNPLGLVFTEADLVRVAELAQRYGVIVIADEIHAPLTYAPARHTAFVRASESIGFDGAVALWSPSKAWNLAGLKCAMIVAGSASMRDRLRAIPAELPYRASHLGVIAALAAFEHGAPWLEALLVHLARNRTLLADLLAAELPAIRYEPPQAGYLAWLDCRALGFAEQPVDVFLARGRVALSRGLDFGEEGRACVRLNFGTTSTILAEIVARMRRGLA